MRFYCMAHDKEIKSADSFIENHPGATILKDKGYISDSSIRAYKNHARNVVLPIDYEKGESKPEPTPTETSIDEAVESLGEDIKCKICGKEYSAPIGLINHTRYKHKKVWKEYQSRK